MKIGMPVFIMAYLHQNSSSGFNRYRTMRQQNEDARQANMCETIRWSDI
jgi:hypothetical protein